MQNTINRLPEHLKIYIVEQDYDHYTARDQACWRHIMRQSRQYFKDHAHPIYLDGLKKTGVPITRIPKISDMNAALNEFGWGAVCVSGFIPPAAFLEFQARKVLAIAADMRTVEHIAYTPAPDIVHEAAGHAPIIADPDYADYLTRYAHLAQKAIYSKEDVDLYEAIRILSDVKENPDSTEKDIKEAEDRLTAATEAVGWMSEAAQVSRMAWWTVEYGLVKYKEDLRIFGAGLLSSVGESQNCLAKSVKKVPFSVDCINQSFDITKPQPQLFVVDHFEELNEVLEELQSLMAYNRGGVESLEKAIKAKALTTSVLDSGIAISGILDSYKLDKQGQLSFMKWSEPVQLSRQEKELPGHGRRRHPHGFSTPIGFWQAEPATNPKKFGVSKLKELGIEKDKEAQLTFVSGIEVKGKVKDFLFNENLLNIITWQDCTVKLNNEILFEPSWGEFDMAVGTSVPSVYGGPADIDAYGPHYIGQASTSPFRQTPYSDEELELFDIYQSVRNWREDDSLSKDELEARVAATAEDMLENLPNEWLLAMELVEITKQKLSEDVQQSSWAKSLVARLQDKSRYPEQINKLIEQGLTIANIPD